MEEEAIFCGCMGKPEQHLKVSCVGCAGSEGRALRRQSLQDKMHTMTPGASKATGAAGKPAARMTRAACRKLAVAG